MRMWRGLWAVLLAVAMLVVGCSPSAQEPEITPTPTVSETPLLDMAPEGNVSVQNVPSVLYYPNKEGTQLVRQVVEISRTDDTWMPQAVVERLLEAPENSNDLEAVFRGNGKLTSITKSRSLVTVDIDINPQIYTEAEIFSGVLALVNTITEIDGVEYVAVLLGGQPIAGRGILVSPMEKQTLSLEVLWLMHQAALDTENVPSSNILQRMTPPLVLFFKDVSGAYLLPEVQTQRTTAENTAVEVLRALMQGPGNSAQLSSVMRNMTLTPSPTIETAEDGVTRYVNVSLAGSRSEAQDATSMWLLCGAITLSLMYNIPDISYVRISLDGQPLTSLPGRVFSEDGTFRWDQFQGDIGDLVQLYFPNRNGTAMVGVMRAVSQEDARLASTRVEELLVGPRSTDSSGITYAFPLEVGTEDLLGVYVSGYCAYVSFSEAFYEACQGLTVQAERMMVYSIVNTLTEIENINQVQFLVEDAYVDSLGGALDLTAPLWRNPGIIQS